MAPNVAVLLVLVFLAMSALFSASETAYFNLQRIRLHHLASTGDPRAKRVARLRDEPEKFLAMVLLGNNLVNTAIGAVGTALAISLLGSERQGLGVALATGAVTIAVVVLGEVIPKTLASRHPEFLAFRFVRLWEVMEKVLFPLALALYGLSRLLTLPFQGQRVGGPLISKEELRSLIRTGAREGAVEETQAEIISRAFQFGDLKAQDLMTPRTEMVWVDKGATMKTFLDTYAQHSHSHFPVYDAESDNVIGVVSLKDAIKSLVLGQLKESDPMTPLVRPAHFFPETKPVDDLFVEMRNSGMPVVVLVNEYGGIAGFLTMAQIATELVGRISEEEQEPEVHKIDERTTDVDASLRVEEANERLGLGLPPGEYDTVAGFILSRLGHIPLEGELVRHNGLRLVITEMKGIKIERVRVTRV